MDNSKTINLDQQKIKILQFLKSYGPNIPMRVSNNLKLDSLIASAFLAELVSERKIKLSYLKVGNSPIYFLPGQEEKLEGFVQFLGSKEKEAFDLLKEERVLLDDHQHPAIRVALRSLKDFAFPFKYKGALFWRYLTLNEKESVSAIGSKKIPVRPIKKPSPKIESIEESVEKPVEKPLEPIKEKSGDFSTVVNRFFQINNLEIIEELSNKKKEYTANIRVNTQLGNMVFLCIAKDKKSITENDLNLALQESNNQKKPVIFVSPGKFNKKAQAKFEKLNNLIFFKQLE